MAMSRRNALPGTVFVRDVVMIWSPLVTDGGDTTRGAYAKHEPSGYCVWNVLAAWFCACVILLDHAGRRKVTGPEPEKMRSRSIDGT